MTGSYSLYFIPVLRIRIRDPVPFSPLDPGSGMNNPDHIFYSLETIFWGLKYIKYLNSLMRIRDPVWRQFVSRIRDGKKSDPG